MKKNIILLGSIGSIVAILSGCSSVQHSLGLDHYQADEYSVPTTPPLSMPPNHNLRAPELHAQPTGYVPTKSKAQAALGTPLAESSPETEQRFEQKAAAGQQINPNIREIVDSEAKRDKGALDRISDLGKTIKDNLTGNGGNTAEKAASKENPANTR